MCENARETKLDESSAEASWRENMKYNRRILNEDGNITSLLLLLRAFAFPFKRKKRIGQNRAWIVRPLHFNFLEITKKSFNI
jgi:hypothetical protein